MIPLAVFVFGLIIGSFLNVCIYRLPRDISIVRPPSACPRCATPIKPWENIPVISYIFLQGKCKQCGEPISFRYPLVELLNGTLYWLVVHQFGPGWHLPFLLAFVSAMVVITFIDLDFQIIPHSITLPGIVIGLTASSFFLPDPFRAVSVVGFKNSLIGAVAGYGLFFLIAVIGKALTKRDAMGGGDLMLMAMIGAFMGWKAIFMTTFLGSLTGSVIGIFLMSFKGKDRKTAIPFGPFLALGALITLFLGGTILHWYLG